MNRYRCFLLSTFCFLLFGCSRRQGPGPLSPDEALKSFRLNEDLRIELFAAEPHVLDPVEIVFDEDGRAFSAEMLDLPDDPPPGKPPRGQVRLLEDTDTDGRIDRSTVFADQLLQVTSMLPWKGGLIVCAAPDILYLKDTNGDGKADERRVLFTGFALVNPESRVTNLRFGIDNWIYGSNNGQKGMITSGERPQAPPVSVLGADFRFRLDRGVFEAESGPTQFGQAMNDWGHRFITENTVHVRHVVLPRRYLVRNPLLAAGAPAQDISDHGRPTGPVFPLTKPQHWREVRTQMRQQRYRDNKLEGVRPLNLSTEVVGGYFSAAAGGSIYSGDLFPEQYRGNLFTGDVSANMVHRDILRPDGVSFIASRPEQEREREFLASSDPWFRPVNSATGPDGSLYIVDMYREFIETPESIPEELKKDMDFYSGDTMGRIYRIVPKTGARPTVRPNLGRATTAELVRFLAHPNGWWRLTAQRLLLERQDKEAVPLLKKVVIEPATPQARLHALYALEGLSSLEKALVESALADPHPGVREHAVRLAEMFPDLEAKLAARVSDTDRRVLFQLALSLGEFSGQKALGALAKLVTNHVEDRWFRTAVLSSKPETAVPLLQALLRENPVATARGSVPNQFFAKPGPEKEKLLEELAAMIGARQDRAEIGRFLDLMTGSPALRPESWQAAGLTGLAHGLEIAGVKGLSVAGAESQLRTLLASSSEKVQSAARSLARHLELRSLIAFAIKEASDGSRPTAVRERAIHSLGGGAFSDVRPVFEQLLGSNLDPELLKTTLESLASFNEPEVSDLVIAHWKTFGPAVRKQALDVLLNHRLRVPALLKAVESGQIERGAFDLPRKEKLLLNPDSNISSKALQLFRDEQSDRSRILQTYRPALGNDGNATRGKAVFEKTCATCHLARRGRQIGPDLSGVSSRTKEQLLEDILNPSKSIQARYANYVIVTRDGKIHDGIIVSESPGTLTLRRSEGPDETFLRANVSEIRSSSVSLMPDGLEQDMSKQDISDLIAFLQGANLYKP
jgi:putative membrane-bound dehydrogenase-like protein